jgi:hypothetical protein
MKNDIAVLEIFLYDQKIGTLTRLPGDIHLFFFNEDYIKDDSRSMLSLSFIDEFGNPLKGAKPTRKRIPPFFPICYLRDICVIIWLRERILIRKRNLS